MANGKNTEFLAVPIECTDAFKLQGVGQKIYYSYPVKFYIGESFALKFGFVKEKITKPGHFDLDVQGQAYLNRVLELTHKSLINDDSQINIKGPTVVVRVHRDLTFVYQMIFPTNVLEPEVDESSKNDDIHLTTEYLHKLMNQPEVAKKRKCYKCVYDQGIGKEVEASNFRCFHICPPPIERLAPDTNIYQKMMYDAKAVLWDDAIFYDLFSEREDEQQKETKISKS